MTFETPNLPNKTESSLDIIKEYFVTLKNILFNPILFFHNNTRSEGYAKPLVFALVTHWIGSSFDFLWNATLFKDFYKNFNQRISSEFDEIDSLGRNEWVYETKNLLTDWVNSIGAVLVDPFTTLLYILFISFIVFVGARILNPANNTQVKISYESVVQITCYSMAASIFAVIPAVGTVLSKIYIVLLMVIGVKESYSMGYLRATLVALFPQVLVAIALLSLMTLFLIPFLMIFFT